MAVPPRWSSVEFAPLAEGADESEILEGYPALDARQLDLSRIWAAAYPSRGRPRSPSRWAISTKPAAASLTA